MKQKYFWLKALLLGVAMTGALGFLVTQHKPKSAPETTSTTIAQEDETLYEVISVIDGDTIKIKYEGEETSVRLIGVNTPETVDPRTTVECYGKEASDYAKNILTGKRVRIEADPTQTDRDKYDRLLRYVYLDNEDVGFKIISGGYGYEYTYNLPYQKQAEYKEAQAWAESSNLGLWAPGVCNDHLASCGIKGNINASGEKIYHVPGQEYYNSTEINTDIGERWFCTEEEAQAAGWRKSKV